jgi:mono/diheme cytochrome c family protein
VLSAGNAHAPGLSQVGVFDAVADIGRPGPECVSPPGSMGPVPPIGVVGSKSLQPRAPGETIAVAYAPDGTLVGQSREPALLWLVKPDSPADASAPRTISLSPDSRADTGHLVFHANSGGGLACASCHPEGGEDGRVWKFACVGDRRTQSLRGGISGSEPFHWDGDMTTFPHLMADQSGALLKWIDTIPGLPARAQPSDAVARGKELFNNASVACATCHLGARLTNNTTVDVGTGKALQVPSLLGLGWRAPLMHNGCASGVADRFGACGGGDKHGHTSNLSAGQITDLVAYLESI